jgi:hypothetical protein
MLDYERVAHNIENMDVYKKLCRHLKYSCDSIIFAGKLKCKESRYLKHLLESSPNISLTELFLLTLEMLNNSHEIYSKDLPYLPNELFLKVKPFLDQNIVNNLTNLPEIIRYDK